MIYNESLKNSYGEFLDLSFGVSPVNYKPKPTSSDYDNGYITRYFVKKLNEDKIMEVTYENGSMVNKNLYKFVALSWRISGPKNTTTKGNIKNNTGVVEQNKFEIDRIYKEQDVDLSKVLANTTEFWRGF